ncbi:MAG: T9SS type A sorting domain-containing protein, partial [candidate division KSB1 bacterium]|nr:T9SS type A sorting domain-containing protein [candidate division KSB1 bacterium]
NGTDGWLYGNKTVALNWVQKVYEFLKQNDPYGRPVTASQSGGLYWSDGYQIVDLPNVHLYETSWTPHYSADPLRSSLWIYGNIAQKLWQDFEKPGIFGEAGYLDNYGKFSAGSAEYIMMYHNALWVSWANGLAATPLWWDFGTKSIFTPELMAQLLAFSKVAKRVDYAHLALSPASLSVPDCDAYALKGDSVAFGWIRDIKGVNVSGKLFRLEGLPDAPYSITWFNTWAGDTIKTNSRLSQDGQLIDQIPRHLQNLSDIAFIVRPARSGDLPERLELMAYPTELYSDTSYTSQITCYILDAQGRICTQANNSVTFRLEGPGTLEGTNPAVPTNGMTKIIFRANRNAGTARIIASSSGLVADTLNIVVQKFLYIDDFEEYTSDADLQTVWQKRYGTDTEAFLESSIVGAGQKSMRLQYKIGDGSLTYAGISRPLVGDWSKARFLTFWLKPNDTGHRLTIRLYVDNTRYWYYFYSLTNSDSTTVTIPLKDFKANYSAPSLDPTALISMALNIDQGTGNWGSGILYFDNFNFLSTITDIETEYRQPMPRAFTLYPNYPNPFNNETIIRYALPGESLVQITVHNIQGQVIEVLVDKKQEAGIHEVRWNAKNIGSGVYFYRMKTREIVLVQKCVLVK